MYNIERQSIGLSMDTLVAGYVVSLCLGMLICESCLQYREDIPYEDRVSLGDQLEQDKEWLSKR